MDLIKAEIARKKKQMEDSGVMAPDKKYFKRGDLAAKEEEEYWRKHKRLKKDNDEEEARKEQELATQSPSTSATNDEEKTEKVQPPRKEVMRRLREREEPITLYAETDYEAFQRLKKLEMLEPEVNKGFKNDFKAAMDQVDEDYLNEIIKSTGRNPDEVRSADVKVKDVGLTIQEILDIAEGTGKGDEILDSDVVLGFLKLVLKMWGDDLNTRPEEEKRSFRGKLASATHTQTVAYIKILFKKLKKHNLSSDILGCLVEIVQYLLDRNYLKANDAYLEMAIGNAPWPIGVTMVGIHARTGREKISARNVAHVLNDETQRKYIQAVKRIMTHCQKYFPTAPSRMVNYEAPS